MGKSLTGKELGEGITQRKDGYYLARFTDHSGKRKSKVFEQLADCKRWLIDSRYDDEYSDISKPQNMTLNAWYEYWISLKKQAVRYNTYRLYVSDYTDHIRPVIGDMILTDIKAIHCQQVLDHMANKGYATSTIGHTKITMHNILEYAFCNDIIIKNPCNKMVKANIGRTTKQRGAMTLGEQKRFLQNIEKNQYYCQYAFLLQTGIRGSEMNGLQWSDIDFRSRTMQISRNLLHNGKRGWEFSPTKSKAGKRVVPLTDEAIRLLKIQKHKDSMVKVVSLEYAEQVFISSEGKPVDVSTYDYDLRATCKREGIPRISLHVLRHTFATRCIEGGMNPKTLQAILGHANITTTMDLYVHATEDEKIKEVNLVSNALKIV